MPRPVSANELLNKSVLVPPHPLSPGPSSIPFQLTYPTMSLSTSTRHLTLSPYPRNEPSRPPFPFQLCPSPDFEYLFVGQSVFPVFEDFDIQISFSVIVSNSDTEIVLLCLEI